MRLATGLTCLALVASALLGMTRPATASGTDSIDGGGVEFAEAVRIRAELGLRADEPYVTRSLTDHQAFPVQNFNGVPLSVAEARELERRMALQEDASAAREWASLQPGYAGGYVDQLAGGVPVFLTTGDTTQLTQELSGLLPDGADFRVERVVRSMEDLLALKAEVKDRWRDFESLGIDLLDVGLDTMANTVTIGVIGLTRSDEAMLLAALPDGIVVEAAQ